MRKGEHPLFHRIKSDECWYFYASETLLIHILEPPGKYYCIKLGSNIYLGETFQFVVPAMAWFAAEQAVESSFSLTACTVAPGFFFVNLEMAEKANLLTSFPHYKNIICRLSR